MQLPLESKHKLSVVLASLVSPLLLTTNIEFGSNTALLEFAGKVSVPNVIETKTSKTTSVKNEKFIFLRELIKYIMEILFFFNSFVEIQCKPDRRIFYLLMSSARKIGQSGTLLRDKPIL